MSKSTQCVKPPASGASGSCMISTNDFVFAGASFQASAGDGFVVPASHVNFAGMFPPSVNAGLEIEKAAAKTNTPIITPPNSLSRQLQPATADCLSRQLQPATADCRLCALFGL